MRYTAMDIKNRDFKKSLRGYDVDEVINFLDDIANDFEVLYKENSSLKEKQKDIDERIEHYTKMENTIQSTLLMAQNAADQSKASAQKEAELIIKNANDEAQKIMDKAHNDVIKINDDYERIKQDYIMFKSKFKNFINTIIDTFDDLDKDFIKEFNVGETISENVKEKEIDDNDNFRVKDIKLEEISDNTLNDIKNFFAKEE